VSRNRISSLSSSSPIVSNGGVVVFDSIVFDSFAVGSVVVAVVVAVVVSVVVAVVVAVVEVNDVIVVNAGVGTIDDVISAKGTRPRVL